MTIDNDCGRDNEKVPATQAEAHSQIALEQSALYAAQLAIARWINSSADAALRAAPPVPPPESARAAWYAQAQQNFQEWLGRGGFAQYDIPCVEPAPAKAEAVEVDIAALPAPKLRRPTMYQLSARRRTGRRIIPA